jgi:hypothetical protein
LPPKAVLDPGSLTLEDVEQIIDRNVRNRTIGLYGHDRFREQSRERWPDVPWVMFRRLPMQRVSDIEQLPLEGARLDDFLHAIPYFLPGGTGLRPFPPKAVINNLLKDGELHTGMSGGITWVPFQINDRVYAQLEELVRAHSSMRVDPPAPDWVKTRSDWLIWIDQVERGVPANQHRELRRIADEADAAWKTAYQDAARHQDPLIVVQRYEARLTAHRAIEDLKHGQPIGNADAGQRDELGIAARRARNAELALQAARQIQLPKLIDEWEQERALAESRLLAAAGGSSEAVSLAKQRANATNWYDVMAHARN